MKICITGSWGLIGQATAQLFLDRGEIVHGIDNNRRFELLKINFGSQLPNALEPFSAYTHINLDITNHKEVEKIIECEQYDAIIHCAGQPSHPKSIEIPDLDFQINAVATLNILESIRKFSPHTSFIFTSSNKVYGTNPNQLPMVELDSRFDFSDRDYYGVDESMPIDAAIHTPFGVSKAAADLLTQEYGKTYRLKTTVLRLGCVTGPKHASTSQHGFLHYLISSVINDRKYQIYGWSGKQVRDQLSASDFARAAYEIVQKPGCGDVYNLGGGKANSISILETLQLVGKKVGKMPRFQLHKQPRWGDHICYYTNNHKFVETYPNWRITETVENIIDSIIKYVEH